MLKMKNILMLFLIFCNGHIYGQDQGIQLPEGIGGAFTYKVSEDRIVKKLKALEQYSPEELTKTSKWWYHLGVSSCKLYLGRDSSLHHFNEAYKAYPKGTCNAMRSRHNTFIRALEEERKTGREDGYIKQIKKETGNIIFSWYLWDLPDFDEFAFIDSCNQQFPVKKVESVVKDSTLNSEIIRRRDQKYRSTGEMAKQQELDQVNRDFVDSLYALKGSLDAFDENEIYQFSMVAHHSEDCDWVYEWAERLIDHSDNGYTGKSLLVPLLERMFRSNDGYCTQQDPQRRDDFVSMIKKKYPEYVERNQLDW